MQYLLLSMNPTNAQSASTVTRIVSLSAAREISESMVSASYMISSNGALSSLVLIGTSYKPLLDALWREGPFQDS